MRFTFLRRLPIRTVTISKGNAGPIDGEDISVSCFVQIEGTTELGVDDLVLSLILTGRTDESVIRDEDEAEVPRDLDKGADGLPCL